MDDASLCGGPNVIGHYLLTLTPAQEDRVLTQRMGRARGYVGDDCRCLVGTVLDLTEDTTGPESRHAWTEYYAGRHEYVGNRYDRLVRRFGERVNAAIRNRILSNRARRTLQGVGVPSVEESTT